MATATLSSVPRPGNGFSALWRTARLVHALVPSARLANAVKYFVRGLSSWPSATRWAQYLLFDSRLQELVRHEHCLLFRLQRPYLRAGLPRATRLSWLQDHFEWLWRHWPQGEVRAWYGGRARLLALLHESDAGIYALQLRLPGGRHAKEGELVMELVCNGMPLMMAAFTVHRYQGEMAIDIGCLQGLAAADALTRMRRATRDLHGLRPRQVVLLGLHALAAHYGICRLLGVPAQAHVCRARRRTRTRVTADYDLYWREAGGVRCGLHYVIPSPALRRPLSQIDARKRALYRRRYALEDSLCAAVARGLPAPRSGSGC